MKQLDDIFMSMGVRSPPTFTFTRIGPRPPLDQNKIKRPILLKFKSMEERDNIWSNRNKLRGTTITLKEDLPLQVEQRSKKLLPIMKKA